MDTADIANFIDAQNGLRETAGATASFGVPTVPAWPGGTAINPDTNLPYDSTVVQTNDEFVTQDITVLIIEKQGSPLRPQADPSWSPSGLREGMDIILDVATADYVAVARQATMFVVMGQAYSIEEAKPYSLGGQTYRWLVYGAER